MPPVLPYEAVVTPSIAAHRQEHASFCWSSSVSEGSFAPLQAVSPSIPSHLPLPTPTTSLTMYSSGTKASSLHNLSLPQLKGSQRNPHLRAGRRGGHFGCWRGGPAGSFRQVEGQIPPRRVAWLLLLLSIQVTGIRARVALCSGEDSSQEVSYFILGRMKQIGQVVCRSLNN